jgi:hypothetical protein
MAALFAAWALAPATSPIYDGPQAPDEPYRYVKPPPGYPSTKPPTTARAVVPVHNGNNGAQYANTAEFAPQISVYVAPGALGVPPGATSITLTATPLAPTSPLPTDGTIVGNVYRISATAGTTEVPIVGKGNQAATIQMRAPTAKQPGPVFEHLSASGWTRGGRTIRIGNDIYQASPVTALGDWALVQLNTPPPNAGGASKGGGINTGLLAGGIALLVIAGAILAIRLRRTSPVGP